MDTKELIGYLSRWCLLAMSVVLVLTSSAAIVRAAVSMRADTEMSIVVSDAIWAKSEPFAMWLPACIEPELSQWDMDRLLARNPDLSLSLVSFSARHIYMTAPQPREGHGEIEILPLPYSWAAFEKWRLQLLVLSGNETVYLVDAHMADVSEPAAIAEMQGLLTDLKRRGRVAFICAEKGKDFVDLRRTVVRLDPEAMLVCTERRKRDSQRTTTTLPKHYLKTSGLEDMKDHLIVITDDPNCAKQITSMRVQAHLVYSRQLEPITSSDYLTRHASLADLRGHINWRPTD